MDRVCAVVGGSRGIGRAVALLMAQRGYRLAIIARNLQGAKAAARELGGGHLALSCDVAKEHDVQNTFEEIEKNLGPVNFLVNAAGINRDNLLIRANAEDMLSQLHTNLLGSMLTCKAAVKTMLKQQRGSIVNVGFVHTDMTKDLKEEHLKKNIPLGRFGDPLDVAHAVVFLLESPYITGHVLMVDGGLQLTM
ncbi:3-oxoacyl-[acyl-carrier-protein] reductase isoform X2 [Hippopotamus amphibius kiboko]|uniref:3-oxoacyl-[acyl-carrier-protein] reductase isoform X2 n=1 Tax=Hippopotamus amphibius kiboko TaxID=575201 RepID=UPI002599EEE0|nr:3-oxoacyl-[acyl-carrier-protein] reductase isoform X2 [Hippopotamus amphibius kiboko]